jgi:two-component system, OmpR family, alkaline phosphatase synthesis response regulator PhoP
MELKILIVEDDQKIGHLLQIILAEISKDITLCENGWNGLDLAISQDFKLIILDVMLPGLNGVEICKKLRSQGINTPILMVTSKSEEEDKIMGLEMGADDYITKPFSNNELLARCKALLRRLINADLIENSIKKTISIGELKINADLKTVEKKGKILDLTVKEFDLLYLFMQNPGRNYSRQDLLERVWGDHFEGLEHTVNSNINRLRMKIEDNPALPNYIITVWGVGYRFNKTLES